MSEQSPSLPEMLYQARLEVAAVKERIKPLYRKIEIMEGEAFYLLPDTATEGQRELVMAQLKDTESYQDTIESAWNEEDRLDRAEAEVEKLRAEIEFELADMQLETAHVQNCHECHGDFEMGVASKPERGN